MKKELLKLQKEIHANAVSKGFWKSNPSKEQVLMLVITEIAEVVEADRRVNKSNGMISEHNLNLYKRTKAKNKASKDIKSVRNEKMDGAYNLIIKGTIEEGLADVAIRLLDYMAGFDIKLDCEIFECYSGISSFENVCTMMFHITKLLVDSLEKEFWFSIVVGDIFEIANVLHIDLLWHIKEKMRYNRIRPMLHNKKY